ncbi:hypothetical protein P3102_10495 [Amycolatopsis sp. QT-25]|uniref:hypothetical protein n=1 Tax=Amycolatopsis sp. QT-25 TaxID=3034022 RepID=UPI0023ED4F35|nr:hypothetical protein [Amycolatopsis sp. QT-25]WET81607.1 hypothetical protein P3102_10495 [Amycolatopsis sp. QT-25]
MGERVEERGDLLARCAGIAPDDVPDRLPAMLGATTGRLTQPEEIAVLVALLASGRVPNVSGSDLVIDGGTRKVV